MATEGQVTFTPGPWMVNGRVSTGWFRIDSLSENAPTGIEMLRNPVAIVPSNANSKFIAKAPEMAEALKSLFILGRAYFGHVRDGIANPALATAERVLREAGVE